MSLDELLRELRSRDVRLWREGDKLRYDGPRGSVTPALLGWIRSHRAGLLGFLAAAADTGSPSANPIGPRTPGVPAPASFAQRRLWFLSRLDPDDTSYHLPLACWIEGPLDVPALRRALETVATRHEILRSTLHLEGPELRQVVHPAGTLDLVVAECVAGDPGTRKDEALRRARGWAAEPFDLSAGPLTRFRLLRVEPGCHLFSATFHHAVVDGWSLGIFERELSVAYAAALGDDTAALPPLPIQYGDYAAWQASEATGAAMAGQLAYWKERLADAPERLELAADPPSPGSNAESHPRARAVLPPELVRGLAALAREASASPFTAMLAAFQCLLGRLAGTEDVVVGTPVAGRTDGKTQDLIGLFLNSVVLRTDLSGGPTFRQVLDRARGTLLGALANQDLPFDRLVAELNPRRSLAHAPLFQILVNQVEHPDGGLRLEGLAVRPTGGLGQGSKYDLTLYIAPAADGTHLGLVHAPSRFSHERARGILAQFVGLLRQVVATPDRPIAEYTLVDDASGARLPDPTVPMAAPTTTAACARLADIARLHPDAVALEQSGRTRTYREVDEATDVLSRVLLASGTQPGAVIAVTGPRSIGLVVAMLAVWRAGGVLLTLDPLLPDARRHAMLQRAHATHLLEVAAPASADAVPADVARIPVGEDGSGIPCARPAGQAGFTAPEGVAYVFFTSGTTGTPKAVLGTHAGLAHFLEWQRTAFGVGPGDRVAQLTGLSFDVVLRDVFLPLTSGATLCLPPPIGNPADGSVVEWLGRERITLLHAVPALLGAWLDAVPTGSGPAALRRIFLAGEPLADRLVRRWRAAFPDCGRITNLYGPTETTLAKCAFEVPDPPVPGVQPIGFAIPGAQAWVLDGAGRPCGVGETGEIAIRTPFRSLGYLDMPGETRLRFRPNPFRDDPSDLVYFTGDRGRFRPDGSLEILGRNDDQVKINGVRVEPAEVTAVIAAHRGVRSAAVVATKDPEGIARLTAFVVPESDDAGLLAAIRTHLARSLPTAMIPVAWIAVDRLPLTPNGKTDRAELARRAADVAPRLTGPPPSTPEELLVARIWAGLLPRVPDDATASFFEAGGHSLLAVRMLAQVRGETGRDVPLRILFEDPTIAGLARAIATPGTNATFGIPGGCRSLCALRATGSRPPLFVFPGGNGGDRELYVHAHIAEKHLGTDQPVFGFRRRGWDGQGPPHGDIEAMARDYLVELRAVQPPGPYFLLGDCTGGNIAFALACRLQAEGETIGWLALADCVLPAFAEYPRYWLRSRYRASRKSLPGRILFNGPRLAAAVSPSGRRWLREKWARRRRSAMDGIPGKAPGPEYWTREGEQYRRAVTTHRPRVFEGEIHLFLSSGNASHPRLRGWERHATRGIVVDVLPGDHWHYLWNGAERLATVCRERIGGVGPR